MSPGLQNKLDFQKAFIFGSKGGSDIDRLVSRNPDRTPLLSSRLSPISCQFLLKRTSVTKKNSSISYSPTKVPSSSGPPKKRVGFDASISRR